MSTAMKIKNLTPKYLNKHAFSSEELNMDADDLQYQLKILRKGILNKGQALTRYKYIAHERLCELMRRLFLHEGGAFELDIIHKKMPTGVRCSKFDKALSSYSGYDTCDARIEHFSNMDRKKSDFMIC